MADFGWGSTVKQRKASPQEAAFAAAAPARLFSADSQASSRAFGLDV
jgi:hypothetical protein